MTQKTISLKQNLPLKKNTEAKKKQGSAQGPKAPQGGPPQKPLTPRQKAFVHYKKALEVIEWMQATYPLLFDRANPKPLKRGLLKDLLALGPCPYSNKRLRDALFIYTGSTSYHASVMDHTHRYNLEGQAVEPVKDPEKAYSQGIFEKRKQKQEAKKALIPPKDTP